jgi:hypothetical protein
MGKLFIIKKGIEHGVVGTSAVASLHKGFPSTLLVLEGSPLAGLS